MKPSDDVVNLFQQFGAKPGRYQELARQQEHQQSRDRWPLVTAMQGAVAGDIPSVVRRGDAAGDAHTPAPWPDTAQPAAAERPEPAVWVQRASVSASAPVPAAPAVTAAPHESTAPAAPFTSFASLAAAAPTATAVFAAASAAPASATPAPEYRAAAPVPPAAVTAAAPSLASRSPLAGLAGLRSSTPVAEPTAAASGALPSDLPSVFARLAGPAAAAAAPQPAAPVWQPRRGPYP